MGGGGSVSPAAWLLTAAACRVGRGEAGLFCFQTSPWQSRRRLPLGWLQTTTRWTALPEVILISSRQHALPRWGVTVQRGEFLCTGSHPPPGTFGCLVLVVSFISMVNGGRRAQGRLWGYIVCKTEASYCEKKNVPPPVPECVCEQKRNFSGKLERKRKLKISLWFKEGQVCRGRRAFSFCDRSENTDGLVL